jgi:vitamin B12 transporter
VPVLSLGFSAAARAQQSASPNLLPSIEVEAPSDKSRTQSEPASQPPSVSHRVVPTAQQAPTDAQPSGTPGKEQTVVVSPTATETPIDQIANSVTVITAKDMERDQRRTVPDALATVPGLNVVQSGGPGGLTSVFMRGTNSNHTKVLIDGIDVSDPSNPNRSFDLGQLLTADIQQIEVLRGPQSGLYGADALGGVISVITKKGEGPPRATGMIEGGSFGTFNQTAGLSGSQDQRCAFPCHRRAGDAAGAVAARAKGDRQ